MIQLSRWKIIVTVLAVALGVLFALPNALTPEAREKLPGFLPRNTLNLGLDLQGGSHLLLEVDTKALRQERLNNLLEDVRADLRGAGVAPSGLRLVGDSVLFDVADPLQADGVSTALQPLLRVDATGAAPFVLDRNGGAFRITMTERAIQAERIRAVDQSVEIVRRRVDSLGTREPSITKQGAERIVVQAPGESDPERLKRVIGQTAKLTFQLVDDTVTVEEAQAGRVPPDSVLLPSEDGHAPFYLVKRRVLVSGDDLKKAQPTFDQYGKPAISFSFNGKGARRFADVTMRNLGRPFAIVLDGKVISAPVIQSPITGGSGEITGNFTSESAKELSDLLEGGALPAPLKVLEQRTVGAELGADAVEAGRTSTLVGFIAILGFMVISYGLLFGGVSVIGLLVNGLLIVAAMSFTQATLTLPGIAGLILTLAVAVDANVLIYERMREEARSGRSLISAMDAGFGRAMVTIIDANVTTLAAAFIMFIFGAGPVRGFAWTLSIGVFTSVFSAVMVSQVLLGLWLRLRRPKTLPIL